MDEKYGVYGTLVSSKALDDIEIVNGCVIIEDGKVSGFIICLTRVLMPFSESS